MNEPFEPRPEEKGALAPPSKQPPTAVGVSIPPPPLFGCRFARLSALIGGLAIVSACRTTVPARPDDLDEGSFAVKLSGVIVEPRRVAVNEVVTGSACRIGEFIRLDSRSMNRRFLIRFPRITPTAARYEFAYPQQASGAEAHLNVGRDIDAISSLHFLTGATSVVARSPWDALGTVQGHLSQYILDVGSVGDSLTASGVFRASRCSDWPYPQQ